MTSTEYATLARAKKIADANAIGIDDALISQLVEQFYSAVRQDEVLGPIFTAHIADWTPHLARMKDFWASVTMEPGRFHGNPMLKHIAIGGLERPHFDRWLGLWGEVVDELVRNQAAADQIREAANRIAKSLLMGIEVQRGGIDAITKRKEQQSC